ncbi:MAG: glucose-1-phosphate adenylyltransferase subunit GlgD [Clostridiales bacterium]|nr:glucose-1-phosphate adenylyltransferase subunit GlgD [Clostridiales bacterium]
MKSIGIILAGGNSEMRLGDLTFTRAAAAMPVGSCYRAIDFALTNMSKGGITKVAVMTQFNSRSLHDHMMSSKWWDFGRKQGGLYIFTPFLTQDSSYWFRGTADAIYQNISFLKKSNEKYVIISSGDAIYKMNFREVLEFHKEKKADVTVVCKDMAGKDLSRFGILKLDENKRIREFIEKPADPQSSLASLGIYVISRELLINLLEEVVPQGNYNLVNEMLVKRLNMFQMYGYEFHGYWSNIGASIMDYYSTNMDFLNKEIRDIFTRQEPYIETKPKDQAPVKFNFKAEVRDAICGTGTIVNGQVEHSVLFRRVYSGENSKIKDSIVMEGCYIGNNCVVENAILDKEVILSDGKQVIGQPGAPVVVKKNTVI